MPIMVQFASIIGWPRFPRLRLELDDADAGGDNVAVQLKEYFPSGYCSTFFFPGLCPVAAEATLASMACYGHYLAALQSTIGEEMDSCAAEAVVCIPL